MKKEGTVKAILERLITSNGEIGNRYSKDDIDKAIIEVRGVDKRTRDNWFNLLWKLEYIEQPEPHIYSLNLNHIVSLELSVQVPKTISKSQTRLGKFLH